MSGVYYLYTDSDAKVVLGITEIAHIDTPLQFEMSVDPGDSFMNQRKLNTSIFSRNTLGRMLQRFNIDVNAFVTNGLHRRFLLEGTQLFYRPYLQVIPQCEFNSKIGIYIAPLNSAIAIDILYRDPDQVNFLARFTEVKIKDRNDLVTTPERLTLDASGKATFSVTSAYPGVSEIRVKDNKYLCYYETMSMRFKQ